MFNPILSNGPSLLTFPPLEVDRHNTINRQNADDPSGSSHRNIRESLNIISNNVDLCTMHRTEPAWESTYLTTHISIAEGQHLRHLRNSVDYSYKVSDIIHSKKQALRELKNIYTEEYLNGWPYWRYG